MKKSLFNASFEQSNKITYNIYKETPVSYDLGAQASHNFGGRVLLLISTLIFMGLTYALGIGLTEHRSNTSVLGDVWNLVLYFNWLKYPIILLIWIEIIITIIHLFPKPNHLITRLFEITHTLILALCCILAIMPLTFMTNFAYMGWIGFGITCVFGVIYVVKKFLLAYQQMMQKMYGKDNVKEIKWINNKTNTLKKLLKKILIFLVIFIAIIMNMWIWKIGIIANYDFSDNKWMVAFAGPAYFWFLGFAINIMFKVVMHTFYFTKYAKLYRVLWKVSDEQWYGKNKFRKMQKKQLKENMKKGD